ncbi:MAG: hypothetical protein ABI859_00785 [Pseudomonadota bacterium]
MSEVPHRGEAPDMMKGPPSGYFIVVPSPSQRDPIDISALANAAFASWLLLCISAIVGGVVALVVALQLPEKFQANALIAPVTQGSSGAGGALREQFGGVAALAGIELGGSGGRSEEALATFESTGFSRAFILAENLLPVLFPERWDAAREAWKSAGPPTMEAAVTKFTKDVRTISQDRKTGFVTVSVTWFTPELAAAWANRMVEMVNERLRSEATASASRSIEYLNQELAKTSVVDLRQAIFRLIQDQVSNAMLANVQREYAFKFIDSAVPPVTRASPKRTLIVGVGVFAGFFAGLLVVLIRHLRAESAQTSRTSRTVSALTASS